MARDELADESWRRDYDDYKGRSDLEDEPRELAMRPRKRPEPENHD